MHNDQPHKIVFLGFRAATPIDRSYASCANANDWLPGYAEMTFESRADARVWIAENYVGADVDGVDARFSVL